MTRCECPQCDPVVGDCPALVTQARIASLETALRSCRAVAEQIQRIWCGHDGDCGPVREAQTIINTTDAALK